MDINKANEISKLVNKINRCKNFLESLENRSYKDEFTINYRGIETCELEESAVDVLINYYKKEIETTESKLKSF